MRRSLAACVLSACLLPGVLPAQTVYESKGPNGPVFSNQPSPGAKVLLLPPLNVMEAPPAPPPSPPAASAAPPASAASAASSAAAAVAYRSFSIVAPEDDGSVVANTAQFEVRLSVDPALRIGEGHAFAVSVDGRPVAQRFTATEFTIPPEFWGDALPPPNQRHQLAAAIVDRDGQVLKQAAPVQFYLRHATLMQRRPSPRPPEAPLAPRPPQTPSPAAVEPKTKAAEGVRRMDR